MAFVSAAWGGAPVAAAARSGVGAAQRARGGAVAARAAVRMMAERSSGKGSAQFTGTYHSSDAFETAVSPFEASSLHAPPNKSEYAGRSLEDALAIVDEYSAKLPNRQHDPTVALLRGMLYLKHDEPQLAESEFAHAVENGMLHIPEPFEYQAWCNFLLGKLDRVSELLESASEVRSEVVGNPLHLYKWWKDTFEEALPRAEDEEDAKPWSFRRAVMLYAIGEYKLAREALVLESIVREEQTNSEFALWDLACVARTTGKLKVASERLKPKELECAPDGLCELLELFRETNEERAEQLRESLHRELDADERGDHAFAAAQRFYLALYYDAYVGEEGDAGGKNKKMWLNEALKLGLEIPLAAAARAMLA